jgi:hypothetical protein
MRRRRGLSKDDVVDLQQSIPSRDVIAEKQGKPVHHGSIEAAENQIPWLRERRKRRPQG